MHDYKHLAVPPSPSPNALSHFQDRVSPSVMRDYYNQVSQQWSACYDARSSFQAANSYSLLHQQQQQPYCSPDSSQKLETSSPLSCSAGFQQQQQQASNNSSNNLSQASSEPTNFPPLVKSFCDSDVSAGRSSVYDHPPSVISNQLNKGF